ncbi:hypothetical protein DV451_003788 [Geotrichum candidum]|uniref:Uncharacterized protein n=1 Tax=Geotrichum candidum TaxID=1173061 RepID=A0A0J9XKY6_GEOCN|nr:hypothetical protein DV451_003788 [Geotrichum candidum]KAI9211817.1 hypothetical protein DS838_003324 [Geotrichum bryndzae]KAF5105749.1 hypothetical protein DV453_004524 [Geotrichum candidum]KAF5109205.1 hypothetical protein DV452_004704 [Geotrichum candidum]KAF5112701.1 hypothetical protein DV454_004051 [Geotrichum candidum]
MISRRYASTSAAAPAPAINVAPIAVKPKKIGAFRGGFVGFLAGTVLTGFAAYSYLVDEYRTANTVVVGDVVELGNAVKRLEAHVKSLEAKIEKK